MLWIIVVEERSQGIIERHRRDVLSGREKVNSRLHNFFKTRPRMDHLMTKASVGKRSLPKIDLMNRSHVILKVLYIVEE